MRLNQISTKTIRMNDLYIYLLKVSAGLAIISVPYYFLLRNDPNLNLKRFYLLLGLLASWIFPLIIFQGPLAFAAEIRTTNYSPSA